MVTTSAYASRSNGPQKTVDVQRYTHEYAARRSRDRAQTQCAEPLGASSAPIHWFHLFSRRLRCVDVDVWKRFGVVELAGDACANHANLTRRQLGCGDRGSP